MWMGKRVQRAARKTHLPKQVGLSGLFMNSIKQRASIYAG